MRKREWSIAATVLMTAAFGIFLYELFLGDRYEYTRRYADGEVGTIPCLKDKPIPSPTLSTVSEIERVTIFAVRGAFRFIDEPRAVRYGTRQSHVQTFKVSNFLW